jgi:hypothetical protein
MTKSQKSQRPPKPTGVASGSWSANGITYRAPTEVERDKAFQPYAEELGRLTYAWNRLHVHLADLFYIATGIAKREIALAIWHSTPSDLAQRKMLRAAADSFPPDSFWKEETIWILDILDESYSNRRNDALHGPLDIFTMIADGEDPRTIIIPDVSSGSPRAMSLANKQEILPLFIKNRAYLGQLAEDTKRLCGYIRFEGWKHDAPFPDRPVPLSDAQIQSQIGKYLPPQTPTES